MAPITLIAPKVIAVAQDRYLTPTHAFPDQANLGAVWVPKYGQDIQFGWGRTAPEAKSVGTAGVELMPKMEKLLSIFASGDNSGMARRLFSAFLSRRGRVTYFDDASLNQAALRHTNINLFCNAALSAPNSPNRSEGRVRIHQALKAVDWDINRLTNPIVDLGVPAFNIGNKVFGTGDFGNGLGVMINGVQYVYVVVRGYTYDPKKGTYRISLRYLFYDVFGLDDDDVREFGAKSDGLLASAAGVGITAWWQLQHQFGFAPLVTRIILDRGFEAPAL